MSGSRVVCAFLGVLALGVSLSSSGAELVYPYPASISNVGGSVPNLRVLDAGNRTVAAMSAVGGRLAFGQLAKTDSFFAPVFSVTDNQINGIYGTFAISLPKGIPQDDPTNQLPIDFNVVFSEPIVSFTPAAIVNTGTATGVVFAVTPIDETHFLVSATSATKDGTVVPIIPAGVVSDLAGNLNEASTSTDNVVTYDITPPDIVISPPSPASTENGPATYTLTYSGADTISLIETDVILDKTGTANALVGLSGSGNIRTVTLSNISGTGTLSIRVAAGTASDIVGNTAVEAESSVSVQVGNGTPMPVAGVAGLAALAAVLGVSTLRRRR